MEDLKLKKRNDKYHKNKFKWCELDKINKAYEQLALF